MIANILGSDALIVLVVAVVVLFGGSQLPKLARNVGAAGHELRKARARSRVRPCRTWGSPSRLGRFAGAKYPPGDEWGQPSLSSPALSRLIDSLRIFPG